MTFILRYKTEQEAIAAKQHIETVLAQHENDESLFWDYVHIHPDGGHYIISPKNHSCYATQFDQLVTGDFEETELTQEEQMI